MEYKNLLILLIIIILIDSVYLYTFFNRFSNQIKTIQKDDITINYVSTFVVYLLITLGLYYFTQNEENLNKKLLNAAILGLVTYGVFDFTNGAIFKNWQTELSIIDTLWGSLLMTSSIYVYEKISKN